MSNELTDSDIEYIYNKVSRGAKLFIGRDHSGRQKIKLVHGPFGLFTERYVVNDQSMARLKDKLASRNNAVA